ncbi:MAG: cytidine deaminase [Flavobacteriales bacterium]|nr:cytidine deaminase [Flavobacteriales bacterium]|tara:strand:+ start:1122 stop:1610 length:489 start_codon:yes stop_codon:yes gene_type:complete
MIEKKITTTFIKSEFNVLTDSDKNLIRIAKNSLKSAYAPYSGFLVGASVLLENGEIIAGNNQENVAYPSGLCAERVAIFYASSEFPNAKIKAIAVTAISKKFEIKDVISPCGACRQVISEYEVKQNENIRVLLHQANDTVIIINSISDLLPFMFISKELKNY